MTLWSMAVLVAALMLLPALYLVIRAIGAGAASWENLFQSRMVGLLLRTMGLALAVTGASALIAIPLAWLTVRTDVP